MKARLRLPLWLGICLLILLDKAVKVWWISANLPYRLNSGVAFGIGGGNGVVTLLNGLVLLLFTWGAFRYGKRHPAVWGIFAAGLANFSDRLIWLGVIDYVQLFRLPLFNPADAVLMIASFVFLLQLILSKNGNRIRNKDNRR